MQLGSLSRTFAIILVMAILAITGSLHAMTSDPAQSSSPGWEPVEQAMGRNGTLQGDVLKFSMPRSDLNVTIGNTHVAPSLALGSWVAFKNADDGSMVMGDLVLTEDEVSPVMKKLEQNDIEITALHNHLLGESPRVMYMHIAGRGEPATLAKTIHDALTLTGTPISAPASTTPQDMGLNTTQLDRIIGYKGKASGNVYQYSIPRAEKITDNGMEIPPSMGVATGINFQPTGNGKAAIAGDFVLTGNEVNPVIRALTNNDIEVTAVHSHMINEEPRLFFMHFWADDDPNKLARGLRAAINETHSAA